MRVEDFLAKLDRVVQTSANRADWMARCPAHQDGRPSLHISIGKHREILINCFAGCTPESIVDVMGLKLTDLFQEERPSIFSPSPSSPSPPPKEYVKPKPLDTTNYLDPEAVDFFRRRGIEPDFAVAHGVTSGHYQGTPSILFPYYRWDQLINTKYRFLHEKDFRMEKGCELIFFGLEEARQAMADREEVIVIVEGELDWLSVKMAGFNAVLSVPNGASGKDIAYIDDLAEKLLLAKPNDPDYPLRKIVIATDMDKPGRDLAEKLATRLMKSRCCYVDWPDGCNDANDYLRTYGVEALGRIIEWAPPYHVDGLFSPENKKAEFLRLYDYGVTRGFSTGYASLDRYFTVIKRYLTLITGVPNSGKSEFMDNIMINMALLHNWRFVVFTPENLPVEEYLSRWAEKQTGKPFMSGPSPRMSREDAEKALAWAQGHVRIVAPNDDTSSAHIRDLFQAEILRWGADAWVIDPFNEIDDPEVLTMRDDKYLSKTIRDYRIFSDQLDVHGFIINHPHAVQKKDNQYPVIDLYDLHGGSMWANKIGAMLSLWRDGQLPDAPVKVYIKKTKTRRIGRRGRCDFHYDVVSGRYDDLNSFEDGG
jgi:twinkle protein